MLIRLISTYLVVFVLCVVSVGCTGTTSTSPADTTDDDADTRAAVDPDDAGEHDAEDASGLDADDVGTSQPSDVDVDVADTGEDATVDVEPGDTAADTSDPDAVDTVEDMGTAPSPQTGLLLRNGNPMPCADPTVVSVRNRKQTYYVYCTGMNKIWKTSDWDTFQNVRGQTTFQLAGMSANSKIIGNWWAPTVIYAPGQDEYIMWVSVPDGQATKVDGRWNTRSLAVLRADSPTGPWTFDRLAVNASPGNLYIDPELFLNPVGGGHFVYWKQYGDTIQSRIKGARVDGAWNTLTSTHKDILNGYGGPGTWEDNVRENPSLYYKANTDTFHMIWSGGHWFDETYATGHSLSNCGPLCTANNGWRIKSSQDRNVEQVIQAIDLPQKFKHGGPGGAVFQDDQGRFIIYAAAALGPDDSTRYLMRDRIKWTNNAPYVDRARHHPTGY